MMPPRYSAFAEMASKVMAVPEVHHDARAAVFLEGGHTVDDAVRADFARVLVADAQAGVGLGVTNTASVSKYRVAISGQRGSSGGTTLAMMMPSTFARSG